MAIRSWIRKLFDRKTRTIRKAPARFRPTLEALEDRTLLSATPTALSLSVSSAALVYGQTETLTATVTTPNGDPTPTSSDGTVSFYAGTTLLGSSSLLGSTATATLTTTALPPGTDNVTARYSGDSSFVASTTAVSPHSTVSFVAGIAGSSVAVDSAGDVFAADPGGNRVYELEPGAAAPIIFSGLNDPRGVAVDAAGDLFIADTGNNQVLEVKPGAAPTPFVSGLSGPRGVAVDGAGNVYVADTGNNQVLRVTADGSQQTPVGANLSGPTGVAVDAAGDVFIAEASTAGVNPIVKVAAADGSQSTVTSVFDLAGMAVDAQGDLFVTSFDSSSVQVFGSNGNDFPFGKSPTFVSPYGLAVDGQGDIFVIDTGGPGVQEINAGVPVTVSDTVVGPVPTAITLSVASQTLNYGQSETLTATVTVASGIPIPTSADGTVTFYDGGKMVGTPQALSGSPATASLTLPTLALGMHNFTATYSGNRDYLPSTSTVQPQSTESVPFTSDALSNIFFLAADGHGGVFVADSPRPDEYPSHVIHEEPDGTQSTVYVPMGVNGLAVDSSGNLFIATFDPGTNVGAVLELPWSGTLTQIFSVPFDPSGLAVDGKGDLFISDITNHRVQELTPSGTLSTVADGFGSGVSPFGLAVDGQGDLFIDVANGRISAPQVLEVKPDGSQTTFYSGLSTWDYLDGVAVDGQGDVFIESFTGTNDLLEVKPDGSQTSFALPNLGEVGLDSNVLAVDGQGDVLYPQLYPQDVGTSDLNYIGQLTPGVPVSITVPTTISVSTSSAAPLYGQSVTFTATVTVPSGDPIPTSADGTVTFYDGGTALGTATLSGSTATATLTTAALAPGVHTYIGASYSGDSAFVAASTETTVGSGLNQPRGVAVDSTGDVFIADTNNGRVLEVKPDGTQTTVASGLSGPEGVAVDSTGDVFIADTNNGRVLEVKPGATPNTFAAPTTVASGLVSVYSVAVDGQGDVFIVTINYQPQRPPEQVLEVKPGATPNTFAAPTTFGSGIYSPDNGVAVDGQGDVFISSIPVLEVKPDGTQTTLGSGLYFPEGVAVDSAGDVFIADSGNNRVVEVKPDGTQTTLGFGLYIPDGVAVDSAGDVFIADTFNDRVLKLTPLAVTVGPASQSISFTAPTSPITFTPNETVSLQATGGASGNPVSFSIDSSSTGSGSINGSVLTVTGAGTLVLDANQAGNSNYSAAAQVQQTLVVSPASQSISFTAPTSPITFVPNETVPLNATASSGATVTFSIDSSSTGSGSINGSVLTVTGAGTLVLDANQAGNSNYSAAAQVQQTLVVSPAPLTVTPTVGQSKVYGAAVPTLTYTASGFVNGDPSSTLTGTLGTTATSASSVGTYAFTTGSLTAGDNYTVVLDTNAPTFAVTAAPLTVTPTAGQSMIYGATVPALAYTYAGLVNNDTSANFSGALATTATSSSSVGGYAITQGTLAATGNYFIDTFNAGTLTVNPAPLTVTPTAGQSMTYGATVPSLTYGYTGLVNGDTSASFNGALATPATSSSSVGGYAITEGTLAATGNYTIDTFNAGTLTVNPAPLLITANNASKSYGTSATFSSTAFTATGLVTANGDSIMGVTETSTGAPVAAAVGTYDIVASAATGTGLDNYTISYVKGTLTVFPALTAPATQTAYENVTQALSGISLGTGLSGSLTFTLAVGHGTLTLGTTSGLTVTGNGSGSVSLTGSTADLNAALATLAYLGGFDYSGGDTLSLTVSFGSISQDASVAITVESIAQQATNLQGQVSALQSAGVLNQGQANSLSGRLQHLLVSMYEDGSVLNLPGNYGDIGMVQSFLNEVQAYLDAGILTRAQADTLLGPGTILLLSVQGSF